MRVERRWRRKEEGREEKMNVGGERKKNGRAEKLRKGSR